MNLFATVIVKNAMMEIVKRAKKKSHKYYF